jgi:hypothetical protein
MTGNGNGREVNVAPSQGTFDLDISSVSAPSGLNALSQIAAGPRMLLAGSSARVGLEIESVMRTGLTSLRVLEPRRTFAPPAYVIALPAVAASSRPTIGAALCRECGELELPGQLRHSFVHASLRLTTQPELLSSMARGPFYLTTISRVRVTKNSRRPAHIRRTSRRVVAMRFGSGILGMALVGGAAYGVTNWIVGLNAGSSAEGQGATVSNLTVAAVSSPSASNLLYPGANGDVVLTITNPNVFPVTITGVDLPTSSMFATGYTGLSLTGAIAGCSSTTSDVIWNFSTATNGSVHNLASSLTVAAASSLTVTMTNDASMTTAAPAACEAAYFSMPSLTGIVATGGAATATTSPTTDSWTS